MCLETPDSTVTESITCTAEMIAEIVEIVNVLLAAPVGMTASVKQDMDTVNVSVTTHAKTAVLAHRQAPRVAAAGVPSPSLLARLLLPRPTPYPRRL